jgi:uncharacterized repeat protein (TIGR03803 family)
MKTKNRFARLRIASCEPLVIVALFTSPGWLPGNRVTAQTFTTLHSFILTDGAHPNAGVILSGNTLYGTALHGGSSGYGTVFAVNTDGAGFTNLHGFTLPPCCLFTNSDGANPYARLILTNNTLYGTAQRGGSSGQGTVFKMDTAGTAFTTLYSFTALNNYTNSDGANPDAGLFLSGYTLYGTTANGGSGSRGTVFAVHTDGTGFTNLHSFTPTDFNTGYNSDGAVPLAGLVLSGNTLYGAASQGGSSGNGTVFAVNTDGTGFRTLHSFTAGASDGAWPNGLILSGNTLYGTANQGGISGSGTVFAFNTDGTGFTTLHSFAALAFNSSGNYTNSDGSGPSAGLILSGNTLYGTANGGGSSGNGTVFAVNTDGSGFTNLYNFTPASGPSSTNSDGVYPVGGLILSGNALFGTAYVGGSSGNGTVFSLSFAPQLTITPSGPNLILSWPTSVAGFDYTDYRLQRARTITGSFADVPGSTSPYTIPIAAAQQFYRLSR